MESPEFFELNDDTRRNLFRLVTDAEAREREHARASAALPTHAPTVAARRNLDNFVRAVALAIGLPEGYTIDTKNGRFVSDMARDKV